MNENYFDRIPMTKEGKKIIKNNRARVRRRKVRKFFAIVFSMTLSFLLLATAVMFGYIKLILSPEEQSNIVTLMENSFNEVTNQTFPSFTRTRITALLVGVDKEGVRTDVIMIATWDKETDRVDLISIPRDTRVTLPNSVAKKIRNSGAKHLPLDNKMKINAINAYAYNIKNSITILRDFIEDMLNINIDYYATIDTTAFAEAIDIIGGVEYDVPDDLYYKDPTQDLLIDLKKGKQTLNGKQAEGLVRFRGYFNGDLTRIKIQQNFLRELFTQVVEKMTPDKIKTLAFKLYKYVETDFKVTGIPEAIDAVLSFENISIYNHTIPGTTLNINTDGLNVSYFVHDVSGTQELIDSIWYPEVVEEQNQEAKEAIKWEEY